jgi:hypothetical protein
MVDVWAEEGEGEGFIEIITQSTTRDESNFELSTEEWFTASASIRP